MAVAGEIVIELKIDAGGVPVTVKRTGAVLRELQGTLNRTATSVKRLDDANSSLSTKFRHLVMTLGNLRFVVMDINDIFLRLPVSILKSAGELERMQTLMTGLSKETSRAAREIEGLRSFGFVTNLAKNSPFDVTALSDAFVKLKTAGIDPTDGSMNALINSVSRFGGTSESLKRASIAIQQMSGKGVVSMEELRQQLGEAVPTAMRDMADGMGVSMADLAKIVQTGTLAAGPAVGKMLNMMQVNNAGAAARLMETWTGTLSRLKTEWALATKYIADSGFGDAAKDAALKLTAALQTEDFRRLSSDVGASLGEIVGAASGAASALVKYREEIGLLVEAWIAYKVVFSGIVPLAAVLEKTYLSTVKNVAAERAAIVSLGVAKRQAAAQDAIIAANKEAELARTVARYSAELAALKARNVAMIAETAKLNASQSVRLKDLTDLRMNMAANVAAKRRLEELRVETVANAAAQTTASAKAAIFNLALDRQKVAAATAAVGINALSSATRLQTAAALAATVAARGFGAAMAIAGGPVGIFIGIVMGLVYWWNKSGEAADNAADRNRRAAAGISTQKDLEESKEVKRDAAAKLRRANANLDSGVDMGYGIVRKQNSAEIAASRLAVSAADKELADAKVKVGQAEESLKNSRTDTRTNNITLGIDRAITARKDAANREIAVIEENNRDILAALDNGTSEEAKKKKVAETLRVSNLKLDAEQRSYAAQIKIRVDNAKVLKDLALKLPADSEDALSNLRAADAQEKEAEQIRLQQKGFLDRRNAPVTFKPLPVDDDLEKNSRKKNKFDAFIAELSSQKEQLAIELDGLTSETGKADFIASAVAKVRKSLETGAYSQVDKNNRPISLSKEQINEGVAAFEVNETMKALAKDTQSVSQMILGMESEFKHAGSVLLNPLGEVDQGKLGQTERFLSKIGMTPAMLENASKSLDPEVKNLVAIIEKLRSMSRTIDVSESTKKVAEDTRALAEQNSRAGASLILSERTRNQEMFKINEEFSQRQDALTLERANKRGVDTRLLEAEMLRATNLRAELMLRDSRSPVEQLADEWQMSMTKMDQASATWSSSFVDMMVSSAKTGKMEFGSFVESVLADILKIQLQRSLGDPLKDIIKGGTDWLVTKIPELGNDGRAAQSTAGQVAETAAQVAAAEAAREVKRFSMAATQAKDGLGAFTTTGVDAATASLVSGIAVQGQEAMATTSFSSSIGMATNAVYQFVASLQSGSSAGSGGGFLDTLVSLGSSVFGGSAGAGGVDYSIAPASASNPISGFKFADGGIISSMGSMSLRKYAAGGIANSPQMAIYGEGDTNEAFVPLPDGRRIPVSLSGSFGPQSAPAVTVNVINQTSQPVSAQQGQPRFDGKQMILDIVLSAASQPGSFRDGMKGAIAR